MNRWNRFYFFAIATAAGAILAVMNAAGAATFFWLMTAVLLVVALVQLFGALHDHPRATASAERPSHPGPTPPPE